MPSNKKSQVVLPNTGEVSEKSRLLLVDDNDLVRLTLSRILEGGGFHVASAGSVNEALCLIGSEPFDAFLSDLHMPGAGDGLTVVSAMRHVNPAAVTIIFSGYPEMQEAAAAILLQADEIRVKPIAPTVLIQTIKDRLKASANVTIRFTQTVAFILEQNYANEKLSGMPLCRAVTVPLLPIHIRGSFRKYLGENIGKGTPRSRAISTGIAVPAA